MTERKILEEISKIIKRINFEDRRGAEGWYGHDAYITQSEKETLEKLLDELKEWPGASAYRSLLLEVFDRFMFMIPVWPQDRYDKEFGDEKLCQCGHNYYRHFNSYEKMMPIGCKYCDCNNFVAFQSDKNSSEFQYTIGL